jgi:hypothetical protein
VVRLVEEAVGGGGAVAVPANDRGRPRIDGVMSVPNLDGLMAPAKVEALSPSNIRGPQ